MFHERKLELFIMGDRQSGKTEKLIQWLMKTIDEDDQPICFCVSNSGMQDDIKRRLFAGGVSFGHYHLKYFL